MANPTNTAPDQGQTEAAISARGIGSEFSQLLDCPCNEVYFGDCRDTMRALKGHIPKVQMCVTSPPYFGLRDYGHEGQIGLEDTPDEYVAAMVETFRLVRDLLTDDGALWLNLGDTYAAGGMGKGSGKQLTNRGTATGGHMDKPRKAPDGWKPKDLLGIPWRVAFALQQPYYTGRVSDERDRVWLAAMVDTEGSIWGTEYQTGDRTKTNIYISITNTSAPIIAKCERLFPQEVKQVYEKAGPSSRVCYRWDVERMETKALFIREIYPYLVAKRKQAVVGYTFIEMQRGLLSKKKGYLPEQHEQRSWLMAALSKLNTGEDVDLPDWVVEPPSLFEPGYYLRQDIIWHKPNPMPESVTDRCTKAHEYLFLLSKNERYYWDAEANTEPVESGPSDIRKMKEAKERIGGKHKSLVDPYSKASSATNIGQKRSVGNGERRNRRSVWSVATGPYSGAHFAVFPPALIEPCILAGSRKGDVVLDPFFGSGTTGEVAQRLGRRWIGCELNREYEPLQRQRTAQGSLAI